MSYFNIKTTTSIVTYVESGVNKYFNIKTTVVPPSVSGGVQAPSGTPNTGGGGVGGNFEIPAINNL